MSYSLKAWFSCILLAALTFGACSQEAGEGGNSSIRGTIWVRDYNAEFTHIKSEYAGADEDVYIIYGDDYSISDRTRSSYNGQYEFKYLRKGKYKIIAYSKDSTLQQSTDRVPVIRDVEITGKKQIVEVPQMIVLR